MQDEQLFGVPKGALVGVELGWHQSVHGTDQTVRCELLWQSRKPTVVTAWVPDDQQISAYIAAWMPVLMNGAWMHSVKCGAAIAQAVTKMMDMGAEVSQRGTKIPHLLLH